MEGLLKDVLTSQPILQIFAGGIALMVVAYMVMRGTKDREAAPSGPLLPPPAPGGLTDVPAIFAQGPREVLDTFREVKENLRRMNDNSRSLLERFDKVADDIRAIKDDGHRRVEILQDIEREQAVANRAHHPGRT